jgi:hypothetical protein
MINELERPPFFQNKHLELACNKGTAHSWTSPRLLIAYVQ